MRIDIITFSPTGAKLACRMISGMNEQGMEMSGHIAQRHAGETNLAPFSSVYELSRRLFNHTDALVFIGACGIAVRAIAPLIKSKLEDPAVVVCDETGKFVISLLSGHVGGANILAGQIAAVIGGTPVITTASDAHTALCPASQPKNLVLGIGCRKGVSAETVERAATILLWDAKIPLARVCAVASIDVKRNEEGLLGFVKAHGLPMSFFSAGELAAASGEFTPSELVLQAVGVDNVCERAAVLCGGKGKLVLKKSSKDGVTVAVFEKE